MRLGVICHHHMAIGTFVTKEFRRWVKQRVWEKFLEVLINDDDFEWLIIDASHVKVHPHACGAIGGNQDMGRTNPGSPQSPHLALWGGDGGSIPKYTIPIK